MAWADIRTMDSRVTAGTPAGAGSQIGRMRYATDEYLARTASDLGMTLQTKVIIGFD